MTTVEATTDGYTRADFMALPSDGKRYELIGGSIVMNPSPIMRHQRASRRLQSALEAAFGPAYEVFAAPMDVHLPTGDILEPDLIVIDAGRNQDDWIHPPITLVVELISNGSIRHDTVTKFDAYARGGVEHYWMVDTRPDHPSFRAFRLENGAYTTVADSKEHIEATAPIEFELDLLSLFDTT